MSKRFNVYRIQVHKELGSGTEIVSYDKLLLLKTLPTLEEAEEWLKDNHTKYIRYTILPEYYHTDFD